NETSLQRLWKFERLSDLTGDSFKSNPDLTSVTKDKVITRLTEQLEQKDIQLGVQDRIIQEQRRELAQKEQEVSRVNGELNNALISLARRNEFVGLAANPTISENRVQNEILTLREKVDRLESLMNKWSDEGNNRPNNVS
ncbi:hypothetical protein RSAG8_12648, partial [Rhizoctonia solani AG-8 WAC10335]